MDVKLKRENLYTLKRMLETAEKHTCAVGSFAPRYTEMIRPVLLAGEKAKSPLIVQISQNELIRYDITCDEFANEFYKVLVEENITVPVVLHLDHTYDFEVIEAAVKAGFTSVMIDASEKDIDENIVITKKVVEYARARGVSVEAELGRIGTTDFIETDSDEELFTDPEEAKRFVKETNVDALAVSVGTAHGVYNVKKPTIDFKRLQEIRSLTPVHLVLHGGSGVPDHMIQESVHLPNGGVSKVNIATDLEISLLDALSREERMKNAECSDLPAVKLAAGQKAVEQTVVEKIYRFLKTNGLAETF
ncbi:ketose-bisphosphate aldolase [Alteribacillus sp. HJP-4]|uniref:class II fructose-bisphosphate aldolase n=1 Tax=Alteribacillus sp. HJP-4 TaxID=2775394 RepID=UPI0035CD35B5